MKPSGRFYAFIVILAVFIAVIALVGSNGGIFSGGDALPPETRVNLIAYVDLEGQIHTISPDGLSIQDTISPEEGFFTWPVWSPDGAQIAFSGITSGENRPGTLRLYVSHLADGETRVIYTNEPGMGPILNGMPHYPIWSPDSSHLAFMASVSQGLTLFLDDISDDKDATVVLRESPLYASWSADSRYMMVHAGVDHFLVEAATGQSVAEFSSQGIGYRAPAWWPSDSSKVALLQSESGVQGLYIADVETGERTLIEEIPVNAAFLWSPDGYSLAVAKSRLENAPIFQNISIFAPDGAKKPIEVTGTILAYFWSPDSSKLAYIVLTQDRGVLRVMMLDMNTGERWPLIDFAPAPDQSTIFQFFDQFAHSHSPWSPDSRSLVFAGILREDGISVSLNRQTGPQIYVVDIGPDPVVTSIAEGSLAFWSPR
ncbi:MAG: PD40 domain-containing protein [Chloroflexi bacterium]|nr:PD40 domain-containing protein [Chloroflexota bacterium]